MNQHITHTRSKPKPANSRKPIAKPDVILWRNGQYLMMDTRRDLSWLEPMLTVRRYVARCSEEASGYIHQLSFSRLVTRPEYDKWGSRNRKPGYACPLGFLPVVKRLLQEKKIGFDERQVLPDPLSEPKRVDRLFGEPPVDDAWLAMVRDNDRGIVRYRPGGVKVAWLIAQVAHAWPDKTVMVWTRSLQEAKQLTRELREHNISAGWDNGTAGFEKSPQVLLGPVEFFSRDTDVQKRQIAIVTDASRVYSKGGMWAMQYAYVARMYGLLPVERNLTPAELDCVRAVFGFDEFQIPEHGEVWMPIPVHTVKYRRQQPTSRSLDTALDVKRQLIWNNRNRNQFLAHLARQVAGKSLQGAAVPASLCDAMKQIESPRIAVLVENIEHAEALNTELPEARIVTARTKNAGSLWRKSQIVIVTRLGLAKIRNSNVLIRGDATADSLPSIHMYAGCCLIDVQDRQHRLLGLWSRRRRRAYGKQGWELNGKVVADTVQEFLASRNVKILVSQTSEITK
jgi:hypothetical protein